MWTMPKEGRTKGHARDNAELLDVLAVPSGVWIGLHHSVDDRLAVGRRNSILCAVLVILNLDGFIDVPR
jgi:hypothetical protein